MIAGVLIEGGGEGEPKRRPPSGPAERSSVAPSPRREESGPRGNVKITACAVDSSTRWPHADLLVTHRSGKTSDYIVHVEFVDASGKRLDKSYAVTNKVAPGQRSAVTAQALSEMSGGITCRITDVTRCAS